MSGAGSVWVQACITPLIASCFLPPRLFPSSFPSVTHPSRSLSNHCSLKEEKRGIELKYSGLRDREKHVLFGLPGKIYGRARAGLRLNGLLPLRPSSPLSLLFHPFPPTFTSHLSRTNLLHHEGRAFYKHTRPPSPKPHLFFQGSPTRQIRSLRKARVRRQRTN